MYHNKEQILVTHHTWHVIIWISEMLRAWWVILTRHTLITHSTTCISSFWRICVMSDECFEFMQFLLRAFEVWQQSHLTHFHHSVEFFFVKVLRSDFFCLTLQRANVEKNKLAWLFFAERKQSLSMKLCMQSLPKVLIVSACWAYGYNNYMV